MVEQICHVAVLRSPWKTFKRPKGLQKKKHYVLYKIECTNFSTFGARPAHPDPDLESCSVSNGHPKPNCFSGSGYTTLRSHQCGQCKMVGLGTGINNISLIGIVCTGTRARKRENPQLKFPSSSSTCRVCLCVSQTLIISNILFKFSPRCNLFVCLLNLLCITCGTSIHLTSGTSIHLSPANEKRTLLRLVKNNNTVYVQIFCSCLVRTLLPTCIHLLHIGIFSPFL